MSAAADESDDLLGLEPGERVLWQGRAAIGAAWPSFAWLAVAQGAFLVLDVTDRLTTWLVITTTRVAAVRLGGPAGVLWEQRLDAASPLRVERTWRAPEGLLVAGWRRLRLRDDAPREVLELVRSAREARP